MDNEGLVVSSNLLNVNRYLRSILLSLAIDKLSIKKGEYV